MSVPHTQRCIFTERFGSFILPLNFLNTKDPTPACLSVCGETDHDTQREIWEEEQSRAVDQFIVLRRGFSGTKHMEARSERGIPLSRFKWLQMCAWRTATAHIWARKLPRSPPLPSSEPWMSRLYNTAPRSTLEKQLVGTHGRGKLLLARQPTYRLRWIHSRASIMGVLKRPLSWRWGREIWRAESLGNFRRERCSL